jgi:2-succinyl-5-enolpyruvyl-6-hydroxy-3-cyclohexene-1-carboxylate synthase
VPGSDLVATTAATFCATLVDEWARAGITDAVVAPGSRSTPMALALAADPRLRVHIHHDERSAGFMALGIGLATGHPALVVTTSGTAAVELHPAVVEADHAKVPLLVCTADRPPELHGVGAPQTIDQQQLYGRSVRMFVDAGVPERASSDSWRSLAAQAVMATTARPPGPVHLNLAFRDPLVGEPTSLPPGRDHGRPWHVPAVTATQVDLDTIDAVVDEARVRRGVIVAGAGIEDATEVLALAGLLGWPVLADPRSECRVPESATISHFDAVLRVPSVARRLAPEMVLRLGALPSSKVLNQWLAGLEAWQVAIETDGTRFDPDRHLDGLVAAPPGETSRRLAARLESSASGDGRPTDDGWLEAWVRADVAAAEAIAAVLARHPEPTEPGVARDVVRALPEGSVLVVSSSMPVRDVEWFALPRGGVRTVANRGANGIDGVVSTAVGVALGRRLRGVGRARPDRRAGAEIGPTALLIGDVALLHDTNGLLGAARRGIDLTIVVVDNDGGGIFSFLPQAEALDPARFETLFGTPHGVDLAGLVAAHGIGCRRLDRQSDVAPAVAESVALGGIHVILVPTDRVANVAVHHEIDAAVADALA